MDDDNPFQRPNDRSEEPPEDEQAIFLDDLTSLFDEEDDDSGLARWDEPANAESAEEKSWDSLTDAAPRWREDAEAHSPADRPDPLGATHATESVSVFEDPEPTEAVEFPSVGRVDEVLSLDVSGSPAASEMMETRDSPLSAPPRTMAGARPSASNGSTMSATVVGLLLGGIVLGAVALGEEVTLAVLVIALLIAAAEWFTTLRHAGYQPPTLVGFAAVVAMPLAAYWRGADGMVLVLVFALFGSGLWYLGGVGRDRPLANLGVTLLGIAYIGVTGAFGGLLLDMPDGSELVLSAVILTVAHECRCVHRRTGRRPHPAVEGQPQQDSGGFDRRHHPHHCGRVGVHLHPGDRSLRRRVRVTLRRCDLGHCGRRGGTPGRPHGVSHQARPRDQGHGYSVTRPWRDVGPDRRPALRAASHLFHRSDA